MYKWLCTYTNSCYTCVFANWDLHWAKKQRWYFVDQTTNPLMIYISCDPTDCLIVSLAAVGAPGQRQGGGSDGLHLRLGSLWKDQEGLYLLWDSLHPESHLGTQRSRWDTPHQSRIWRCVFIFSKRLIFWGEDFFICHFMICICFSSGDGVPTVFVAVAGRSNGLGPVMSGNTAYPVINCPPLTPDWGAQDVWSSLRMPSGKRSTSCLISF